MPHPSNSESAHRAPAPLARGMMALAFLLFLAILAAYAGLIPLGHWQDEFRTFPVTVSDKGLVETLTRMVVWSPRPFSEALIYVYAHLVDYYQSPLIGTGLAAMWLVLTAGVVAVPLAARRAFASPASARQCLLLSLGLYCLMVAGHAVGEFLYWPQAAVAYLPATAGLCAALWTLIMFGASSARARRACGTLLTLAALSAEVGSMLVVVFCLLLVAQGLLDRLRKTPGMLAGPTLWLKIPFFASALVLVAIRYARFGNASELFGDAGVAHHLGPTLLHAAASFAKELLAIDGATMTAGTVLSGVVSKLLFFWGACGILRPVMARAGRPVDGRWPGLFGLACFATAFLILAAAYFQFGLVCCERHATFRQCLVFIGLLGVAAFVAGPGRRPGQSNALPWAPTRPLACLLLGVLIPATTSVRGLASDYAGYHQQLAVDRENWAAGKRPGEHFVYRLRPEGKIIGGNSIPNGTYTLTDDSGWFIHSIIGFFNKTSITFENTNASPVRPEAVATPQAAPPAVLQSAVKPPAMPCFLDHAQRTDGNRLSLQGWTAPGDAASAPSATWAVLSLQDGRKYYVETALQPRPDVAQALRQPALENAGFAVLIDLGAIPGQPTINLLTVSRGVAYDCGLRIEVK